MASAYERIFGGYSDSLKQQQAAQAAAEQRAALINGVPVASQGATRFEAIDQWLNDNPDAKYFRIGNSGNSVSGARSYQIDAKGNRVTNFGYNSDAQQASTYTWSDNSAALVSTEADQGARDIFRYINVSAMAPREGKRGEKATFGQTYNGGEFFSSNNLQYSPDDGIIMSREEYGALKESLRAKGAGGFFQYEKFAKKPPEQAAAEAAKSGADLAAKADGGRGVEAIVQSSDQLGGAQTEQPGTDVSTDDGSLNKRTLLG